MENYAVMVGQLEVNRMNAKAYLGAAIREARENNNKEAALYFAELALRQLLKPIAETYKEFLQLEKLASDVVPPEIEIIDTKEVCDAGSNCRQS